jgi:hypothetical protein
MAGNGNFIFLNMVYSLVPHANLSFSALVKVSSDFFFVPMQWPEVDL